MRLSLIFQLLVQSYQKLIILASLFYKDKFVMNTNNNISFEKSFQLFKKNERTLPQKIRWKLDHISRIIEGKQTQKTQNLPEQYQMEIHDLKDVNQKGLKIIFTSIIQTLFNEQIPIDKQCLVKKKGFFKSWTDGFIKYDDTYIYFNSSNKTSRYRFKNIDVNLNGSSKRAFDFFYKGIELMTVKFQKPESMQAMYKTIKTLILREKHRYDEEIIERLNDASQSKTKKKNILEANKSQNKILNIGRNDKESIKHEISEYETKNLQSSKKKRSEFRQKSKMQFERSIISKQENQIIIRNSKNLNSTAKELKLNSVPQNFQIKQSSKKMYIAFHVKEVKMNLQIILHQHGNLKLNQILSCLCLYRNWNSKVMKEELCYQMKYENQAIIYRVYERSTSLLSKCRQTYTILQFKKLSPSTAILVEESLENQDRLEQYTRAYLKTIVFIETYQNSLKICIQSEFDPKGFCSQSEAQQLLLSLYKDIIHFQNYLSEYSIKQEKDTVDLLFFDIQPECQSTQTLQIPQDSTLKLSSSHNEIEHQKSSDQEQESEKKRLELYRRSTKRDPFFQLKPDSPNKIPTIEYLQLIQKLQFQRYFFKHRFQFQVIKKYDDYIPWYCLEEMLKKGGEYEITQSLELHFINEKLIQSQKDILRFLIRQIGANLISGKSVLNVSLPVDIFQGRTLLERSAASFGKCPDYLMRSCQASPLQQIMNVAAFIASVPSLELIMQKPFNPILGQTFQCYLKGIPLYYEQISHHPPISSYFMECSEFKMYGNLIAFADVGLNSGVGGNLGAMHIIFKNGYHYECYFPPSQISGLIYGERKFRCYGRGYIVERSQNLFAQFSIQKQKKGIYESKEKLLPGSIIGGIFKVNKKFFEFLETYNTNLKKFPGLSKEHITQKLIHINGMWFDKIYMNERIITQGVRAYPVQYYPYCLPSDGNFRLDVLYHKQNNLPQSQRQKQILQSIQREDRKLRQRYEKQAKKTK